MGGGNYRGTSERFESTDIKEQEAESESNRTHREHSGSRTEHTENTQGREQNTENTHGADFLEVAAVRAEVDELLVEEPGELEVQRVVVGHVAGQDDALPHRHVQVACRAGDGCGLWRHTDRQGI